MIEKGVLNLWEEILLLVLLIGAMYGNYIYWKLNKSNVSEDKINKIIEDGEGII